MLATEELLKINFTSGKHSKWASTCKENKKGTYKFETFYVRIF